MKSDPQNKPERITMRDIAQAANVSQSTVSRVLSDAPSRVPIGKETRRKVLAAVESLNYHPNQFARSLRGQKSQMIGMMIADITNPFYHSMVRAVQDVALQHNYNVMIANSDHSREKEVLFCDSILRHPVDGVIMVPYHLDDDDLDKLMVRTGVAIGVVGNHIQHPHVDVAYGEDGEATYEAVRWLIQERGHQRIAMIAANRNYPVIARRKAGFRRALAEAGLPAPKKYIVDGDWSVDGGRRAIRQLLEMPEPPTAVFAANDTMAIGALEEADEMNYRIPQDIAIIGFDNIPEAQWVRPKLTTIAQYSDEMGHMLANALFKRIESDVYLPRQLFQVPCRFIERESA